MLRGSRDEADNLVAWKFIETRSSDPKTFDPKDNQLRSRKLRIRQRLLNGFCAQITEIDIIIEIKTTLVDEFSSCRFDSSQLRVDQDS